MLRFARVGLATVLMLGCWNISSLWARDALKIGVVDFQRFLSTSESGRKANERLRSEGGKIEARLKEKGGKIEGLENRIKAGAYTLSREKRQELEREYRILVTDFQMLEKDALMELKELEQQLIASVRDELLELLRQFGEREGYHMIVERSVVPYFRRAFDVTDKLIVRSNTGRWE